MNDRQFLALLDTIRIGFVELGYILISKDKAGHLQKMLDDFDKIDTSYFGDESEVKGE